MQMIRRSVISVFLILILIMSAGQVFAHSTSVTFNGEYVDVAAVIVEDRTLLPARDIVDLLGGSIYWDEELRQVTILQDDIHILITIDSETAVVDNETVYLDVPAQIINDRTKVPLRFVAESLGVNVDFVDGTVVIDEMVWLSATGVRWHAVSDCGNMIPERARLVTLQYARASLEVDGPCSICNPPE